MYFWTDNLSWGCLLITFLESLKKNHLSTAIIHEDKEYSYGILLDKIFEFHKELKNIGIPQSSKVVILGDYSFLTISMFFALSYLKVVVVPITSRNQVDIEDKIAISEAEFLIKFNNQKLELIKLTSLNENNALFLKLKKANHAGLVLFSSGTTGFPKAMLLDLDSFYNKLSSTRRQYRTIVFLMFDHIGGLNTLLQILASGGTLVVPSSRDVSHVLKLIETYSVELLPTSPTFLNLILISEVYKRFDLSSLNYITYGTEPMPQTLLNRLNAVFPNAKFKQTYGLSELGIIATRSKNADSLFMKLGNDGFEYKVVDSQLFLKSETSMLGYLNAESPFDKDGFFATGDIVEEDEDGYIRIIGRIKDLINVGGQKVTPSEVENIILNVPGVLDVTVSGEKNSLIGEIVVAYILAKENINKVNLKETVLSQCIASLEDYKVPVRIKFLDNIQFSERYKKTRSKAIN